LVQRLHLHFKIAIANVTQIHGQMANKSEEIVEALTPQVHYFAISLVLQSMLAEMSSVHNALEALIPRNISLMKPALLLQGVNVKAMDLEVTLGVVT